MILCANPRCRAIGRHTTECDQECRGCLPRVAADGRNLCEICTRRLAEDAHTAGELYTALELALVSHGRGQHVSGTRDHGLEARWNDRAQEARTLIRHRLVSWTLFIAEERGFTLPRDTITTIAGFVADNATWLSQQDPSLAGAAADELHEIAHAGPWRTAYPSGTRTFPVAKCPDCDGQIHATIRDTDSLLPSVLECDLDETHVWTADMWRMLGRRLHPHTSPYISSLEVAAIWRLPLGTVRWLANRDNWPRVDGAKPARYLAEAVNTTMSARARRTA